MSNKINALHANKRQCKYTVFITSYYVYMLFRKFKNESFALSKETSRARESRTLRKNIRVRVQLFENLSMKAHA